MSEWTETARRILDEYCARTRTVLAGTGADADEVIDDLKRHIEEEVRDRKLSVVTEDEMRRILARVGEPESASERKVRASEPAHGPPEKDEKKRPGFILLILGVIFPVITLVFELVTGASAGVLLDPFPTWFHTLAVALVPVANFWIWRAGRLRDARPAKLLGWLNAAAIGICLYYAVVYIPFVPFATVGIIFYGLGLIPLTPLLAFLATPFLRQSYCSRIGRARLPGALLGTVASAAVLVLLQLPAALTYYGLAEASSENPGNRSNGVRVLRNFGDEELMLRACYGMLRGRELELDPIRALASGNQPISADAAREAYYRVTGKPFNSAPAPSLYTRMGRWSTLEEEFTWDAALGGEAVAQRVKGLSLASSRMDAVAEPDAALVYCEWTLEFKNVSPQPREARAQIALPPGAVVSRVTLWVNGEEREAAFGGRSQVRQAYQQVAVVQRRDPILVTTCGPDRVLAQCFPVPASGGMMKVRLGITAPLVLDSAEKGKFVWPRFLERNFGIGSDLKHSLWIESPARLTGEGNSPAAAQAGARPFTLHRAIAEADLASEPECVEVHRPANVETVWTPAEAAGRIIRQTLRPLSADPPSRIVMVIDGSKGMQPFAPDIAQALSELPQDTEITVIMASDQTRDSIPAPRKATPAVIQELQETLRKVRFVGGQDSLPALEAAWDLAATVEKGVVLWIHQPQPVLLCAESGLRQRIERAVTPTRLFELQTRSGPDRVVEKLDGLPAIEHVPRFGPLRTDLGGFLAQQAGKNLRFGFLREQIEAAAESAIPRASRHIERLWARDEAKRLVREHKRDAAAQLAALHQLVTPLTGAVVLETREQFTQHGLKPADPATVPAVPEPSAVALIGVGICLWVIVRCARRKKAAMS